MMRKGIGLLEVLFIVGATVFIIYASYLYIAGPKVLVYEGDAPHSIGWLGLPGEYLKLRHDGYTVVKASSPEELKNEILGIHVSRILYEKSKDSRWVMFIDDTSKRAVYYRGSAIFDGDRVYVPKPALFGLVR